MHAVHGKDYAMTIRTVSYQDFALERDLKQGWPTKIQ
jgi:hypothetical protein